MTGSSAGPPVDASAELPADVHTLSGAYAIGAVHTGDEALFERHLAGCPECQEEVRGLREALVRLVESSAVQPPDDLKQRVLAQVRGVPQVAAQPAQVPPAQVPPSRIPAQRRPGSRVAGLVAAMLVLVAGTGVLFGWNEHRSAQSARQSAEAAARTVQAAEDSAQADRQLVQVLGDPAARRVTEAATGGGDVLLVVAGQDRTALVASGMPALQSGAVYQLWIVRPAGVSSAGLGPGGPGAAGRWSRFVPQVRGGDVVAISVEPSGGSAQPTTVPIVTLKA